jgi:hypothetical protein
VLGAVVNFGNVTMDPRDYLAQMYADGAKGYFDALSFHPYQYTTKFSEGALTPDKPWNADSPLQQLIAMRQLMIDNGDAALRIWATEYGLPTAGVNGVTEQQQADFIKDFLDAWHNLDYTGPAFIYTTVDRMDGTEDGSFGIFTKDQSGNWVPKLAAQIIKDAIAARQQSQNPPDLGAWIGQVLGQLYQQLFQVVAQSVVNAIAQALSNLFAGIFNPTSTVATALSLPAGTQAAIAEGTTAAAQAAAQMTVSTAAKASPTAEKSAAASAEAVEPGAVSTTEVKSTASSATDATATQPASATEPTTTPAPTTQAATGKTSTGDTSVATATPGSTSATTEAAGEPKSTTEGKSSTDPTSDSKAADGPKANTPGRKDSDDAPKGDGSKKDTDAKANDDGADGANSGGRHAEGSVKNGTSVNDIKAKVGQNAKPDSKVAAEQSGSASSASSTAS